MSPVAGNLLILSILSKVYSSSLRISADRRNWPTSYYVSTENQWIKSNTNRQTEPARLQRPLRIHGQNRH